MPGQIQVVIGLKTFIHKNGFEISLLEYISELNLDKFFIDAFESSVSRFKKSTLMLFQTFKS